jgi:hypothetical protein
METSKWVEERMASLDPPAGWLPDTPAAVDRHRSRRQDEWRRGPGFWWKLAMAAGILMALALAPPTRGWAQHLWRMLTVRRIEAVKVDLGDLPEGSSLRAKMIQHPGKMTKVDDAESARARVGFLPRLPRLGILKGSPRLSVMGAAAFGTVLKADDLRQLLTHAGIDETVPPQWDGARLSVQTSGTVMAEWPDGDTILMQTPPLTMALPDNFDLRAFTVLCLRGLRVPREEAERLGARMATAPAWMLPIDPGDKVAIREVPLGSAMGTMIYDYDAANSDRIERLTLIWSTSDRVYILSGGIGDTLAIAVANAIE